MTAGWVFSCLMYVSSALIFDGFLIRKRRKRKSLLYLMLLISVCWRVCNIYSVLWHICNIYSISSRGYRPRVKCYSRQRSSRSYLPFVLFIFFFLSRSLLFFFFYFFFLLLETPLNSNAFTRVEVNNKTIGKAREDRKTEQRRERRKERCVYSSFLDQGFKQTSRAAPSS